MPAGQHPLQGHLVTVDQVRAAKREIEMDLTAVLLKHLDDLYRRTGMRARAVEVEFKMLNKLGHGEVPVLRGVTLKMEDI